VISFALPSVSTKAGTVGVRGLRSSEVVYKDGGGFNEGCDGFFLDHCIVWENGFRKTHDHGFRESVVLHESAGTYGGWTSMEDVSFVWVGCVAESSAGESGPAFDVVAAII
jgi:hypothetical protein